MAVTLTIEVPQLAAVIALYDRIKVYRSPTETGAYVEITTAGTRIPLASNLTVYSYADTTGSSSNFYRVSYFNTSTLLESSQSESQIGESDLALNVLSVDGLKQNFLFGLDLTDQNGNEMPNSFFEFYIKSAVSMVEDLLDTALTPKTIVEERADFYVQDYYRYVFLQCLVTPVQSVQQIQLVLPSSNSPVIVYDSAWTFPDKPSGQVMIVPGSGNTVSVALGLASTWLPLIQGLSNFLPDPFRISYTAGFEDGKIPYDLKEIVGMTAALGPLAILGDLIHGIGFAKSDISLDQLMTSVTTTKDKGGTVFYARLEQYRKEIRERMKELRRVHRGHRFVVA